MHFPKCLIVDDEPRVRDFIAAVAKHEHFETLEAEGGNAALKILQSSPGGVDLIITDVNMPDGDGLTLAHEVRQRFPHIPVIVISGYAKPCANFEFLQKPFSWSALAHAIGKFARAA